jgi:transposase
MEAMLYCCCGLDVHRDIIEACIIRGLTKDPEIIHERFSATRSSLDEMANWLIENDCYTVAMESTGVYWKPVYNILEACSEYIESIWVVNAHHMRNLPGKKSDVADAEWIATLLRHGLLSKSFVPTVDIRTLRECSRLHRSFVQEQSRYKNRIEKFLQAHGFKFSSVMSDVFCVAGMALLNKLHTDGMIEQEDIKRNCSRLRKSTEEIAAAVCGKINNAEQRLLGQLLRKLNSCAEDIASILDDMRLLTNPYQVQMDILDSIPGINEESAMQIIAEISADPQEHFNTDENLVSWAGLAPRNDESAGKIKSRKIMHGNTYLKSILCQVAWASIRARRSQFNVWFYSHRSRLGQKKAIIAVARKILKLIYLLLSTKQYYVPPVTV